MMRFLKWYALEIYTFVALVFLLIAGLMENLAIEQKFVMVYMLLFVFHEWEEGIATSVDYLCGFLIMIVCFIALQRSLFAMVGVPYRELPKMMRARISKLRK